MNCLENKEIIISEIDSYLNRLFPICRSLTGNGNRETLETLKEIIPLNIQEILSGSKVYDWVVPDEWNVKEAFISTLEGERIVDINECNLHLVGYSEPVDEVILWDDLKSKLYLHPQLPDVIPYRTTYYHRDWGFCVTRQQYDALRELNGPFHVVINSQLEPGSLTYGELLLPGDSDKEFLVSTYICHPSMANDSLSGVILTAFLARYIMSLPKQRWSYRFVFAPETIGAIAYSCLNEGKLKDIDMGLVITTAGGPGIFGYKQSFDSTHPINDMIEDVFNKNNIDFVRYPFDIHGSDERQYSSIGFRINVATITKDKYYEYPEYHSSADSLSFVKPEYIYESFRLYCSLIDKIEKRKVYVNRVPFCEPMLSKRDLYSILGGGLIPDDSEMGRLDIILWILFLCDGTVSVQDLSKRLAVPESVIERICSELAEQGLLEDCSATHEN
jgi:aminopeptidase-like protein